MSVNRSMTQTITLWSLIKVILKKKESKFWITVFSNLGQKCFNR